jgi:hypothetical protein
MVLGKKWVVDSGGKWDILCTRSGAKRGCNLHRKNARLFEKSGAEST